MFKTIALTTLMTLGTLQAAVITCKKDGRYWYPTSPDAIKIAKMLKVKTCNGKRFKQVVEKLGAKSNVASTKKYEVADIVKALK